VRAWGRSVAGPLGSVEARSASAIEQRAVRVRTRGLIRTQYPTSVSSDVQRGGRKAANKIKRATRGRGIAASHSWDGEITMGDGISSGASRGARDVAAASTRELDNLQTVVHEELHGYSPATWRAYQGIGKGLEEATVEIRARQVIQNLVRDSGRARRVPPRLATPRIVANAAGEMTNTARVTAGWPGAYQPWVERFYAATAQATGLTGEALEEFIDSGLTRHFSTVAKANNPNTLLRHIVNSLAPHDQAVRRRLSKALRAARMASEGKGRDIAQVGTLGRIPRGLLQAARATTTGGS
jgi:hypothetical protein